jgi:ankyrin repeat protein
MTEEEVECCVCNTEKSEPVVKTECGHHIHMRCMLTWSQRQIGMNQSTTCPVCRKELLEARPPPEVPLLNVTAHRFISTGHGRSPPPPGNPNPNVLNPISILGPILLNQQVHQEISEIVNSIITNIQDRENPIDLLVNAVHDGDLEFVRTSIEENPHRLNVRLEDYSFLLLHAVYRRKMDVVELLLEKGANPRMSDKFGVTALHAAIAVGNFTAVKKLVNRGACIEVPDRNGETPLFYAVRAKDVPIVSYLVRKRADVNVQNYMGNTVLHLVAQGGFPFSIVQILRHANPNCLEVQNYIGDSALHVAVENCNYSFIRKFRNLFPMHSRFTSNLIGFCPEDYIQETSRYNRIRNLFSQWNVSINIEETSASASASGSTDE